MRAGNLHAAELAVVGVCDVHRRVAEHGVVDPRLHALDLVLRVDACRRSVVLPAVNVTSEPPAGRPSKSRCSRRRLQEPVRRRPRSRMRSSTAAACRLGHRSPSRLRRQPGAPCSHAKVPLTNWSGRCSTGAGRKRPGSTTWRRATARGRPVPPKSIARVVTPVSTSELRSATAATAPGLPELDFGPSPRTRSSAGRRHRRCARPRRRATAALGAAAGRAPSP